MNWKLFLFSLTLGFFEVTCATLDIEPCAVDDSPCLTKLTSTIFKSIVYGVEDLGVQTLDPIELQTIEGNFDTLKYTLSKSTVIGFSDCKFDSVTIAPDQSSGVFKISCPKLKMSGQYLMDGTLLGVPIKGNGNYKGIAYDYMTTVYADLKQTQGSDGEMHISFKTFKADGDLKGDLEFKLDNLFDGNKELGDAVNSVIKENKQLIVKLMQEPIVDKVLKTLLKNFNKYLATVPIKKMFK